MAKHKRVNFQPLNNKPKLGALLIQAGIKIDQFKTEASEKISHQAAEIKEVVKDSDWESIKKTSSPINSKNCKWFEEKVANSTSGFERKPQVIGVNNQPTKKTPLKNRRIIGVSKICPKQPVVTLQKKEAEFDNHDYLPGIPTREHYSSCKKTKSVVKSTNPVTTTTLPKYEVTGLLNPKRSSFKFRSAQSRSIPDHDGINVSLAKQAKDEIELIIGLDFGTSSVKVVLHDPQRKYFFAVPFYSQGNANPFIFPSRIWLDHDVYSIDEGESLFSDLKLPLMEPGDRSTQLRHATAFLALVIRHVRGWLFTEHKDIYKDSDIVWAMNLGLPAAYHEKDIMQSRFKILAIAAINLAGDRHIKITPTLADTYLKRAKNASSDKPSYDLEIHQDMVSIFPEIGAQARAFVESEAWDAKNRPFITMIDVGAGTVDVSFFGVKKEQKKLPSFDFFQNSVEPYGVINLHRSRIKWLKENLSQHPNIKEDGQSFLTELEFASEVLLGIPEKVCDYFENLGPISLGNPDDAFYDSYRGQVNELLKFTKQNRVPLDDDKWKRLPLFLCGGGSRMEFFQKIVDQLNRRFSWMRVELESLSRPLNLRADGLPNNEYDRLSVAYGLSFQELGTITPSYEIDNFRKSDLPIKPRPIDVTDDG